MLYSLKLNYLGHAYEGGTDIVGVTVIRSVSPRVNDDRRFTVVYGGDPTRQPTRAKGKFGA